VLTLPEPSAREREHALVVAAQRGDAESFAALVRLHQRRAYAVARAIVLTHEDAEDAVQEGFLHAFRALDRFLPDQAFGAWLNRIVANAALDITRRKKVRDADALAKRRGESTKKGSGPRRAAKDADAVAVEVELEEALGMSVELNDRGGAGELKIKYASLDQLDELIRRLSRR